VGYVIDGRQNDAFKAVNLLVDKGVAIRRVDTVSGDLKRGDFIVAASAPDMLLSSIATETGVGFAALKADPKQGAHAVTRLRTGMYQRYNGGNMDEGWTRFLLEDFSFRYATLMDAEIKKGNLNDKYDVIILPDDSTSAITGERSVTPGSEGRGGRPPEAVPPEYRSGIGAEGVEALKTFVRKGGTLVTLAGASAFAIEKFALPIRNAIAGHTPKEFWCPGSTLKVLVENQHPLAYGMPPEALAVYLSGNPAFEIMPTDFNERYDVVVRYVERDILQSGWLIGEEHLARKAAMVAAKYGEGKVVLIGFRAQHRAQTHGTYKLLFNTLVR
jgi:hypothetical protein